MGGVGWLFGVNFGTGVRATTRVLQKVLSLGSDYFSVTFYQTYFYDKPSKYPPVLKHFCNLFFSSREKQINSLLLVSVGDTDK